MLVMIGKSRYIEKLKIIRMRVAIISILWCLGSSLVAQQAWWNADQSYYHIPITEAGVYRLSQEVLLETDIPWEDIEPGAWELWREGQRIPVFVDDEGDRMYLEFAAHEPDAGVDSLLMSGRAEELLNPGYSMFSDTAHYYLSWSETGSNIGQTVYPVLPPLDASQRNSYVRTDTRIFSEQWVKPYSKIGGANIFLSEFQAGEGFASERTHSFEGTVSAVNPEPGSPGQLSLRFIGDFGQHDFAFSINGEERWQEDRGSFILENVAVNVDAEDLQNPIQYTLEGRIDNRDRFYVAEQQLIYHSQLRGEAMEGQGALDTGRVVLDWQGGLADSTVYYDLTNEIRYVFSPEGASWLSESPGPHEFLYAQKSAIRQLPAPARVESNLGTAYLDADYVILTSKRLAGGADNRAIQEYADYRSSEAGGAYDVAVINVEDLYLKYGFGVPRHPLGVRRFAQDLDTASVRNPMIFIIGKGQEYRYIRDPESLATEAHRGFTVPTYGYPSSDHLLFARPGASAPIFPVGRLSVESEEGIWDYLEKIQLQESRPQTPLAENTFWRKKVLHLVGGGEIQPLITTYMENMAERFSGSFWDPELLTFERGSSSSTERPLTDEVYDEINEGSSLVTFFGHSATNSLGFDINIPSKYKNSPRHPFLIALGCYGGNINTEQASVGEIYSSFEGGGFIGSIATSGPGEVTRLYLFARQFYTEMGALADQQTMAQMFHAALEKRAGSDPRHVQQLMYFGDPALRIFDSKGPDYTFDPSASRISPQTINVGQDSFSLRFDLVNLGRTANQTLPLRLERRSPTGTLLDEQFIEVSAPANRMTVSTEWAVGEDEGSGLNRIRIFIDPEGLIDESPLPAARNNNELQIGGESGIPFFIFNNGIELAWPYQYAIVSSDSTHLVAHTSNPTAGGAEYIFEIDTVADFSSTFLQFKNISSRGGRIEWALPFRLEPERVYYWRAALLSAEGIDTVWKSASFVHVPGREGWNQSHIGQWLESDSLFVTPSRYRLELPKEALNITIQNRVKGGAQSPNFVANGINVGSVNRAWDLVDEGIGICVIDTLIFTLQPNPPGGLYGSVNDNRTTRAFVFRTDSSASRADAVRFLDSIVPDHSNVFIFTIFDGERNGQSLQLDEWAADTLVYGTSLLEALERRGSTTLQNLMQEERQVYNFFYRQNPSGFDRLQEDFLFSTEDVLINSETMGRRLPEGFFQTSAVDLYADTVTLSVDFDLGHEGDSVRVSGLSPEDQEEFDISTPDTVIWEVPETLSAFSFFTQLMNFETRQAPDLNHLRVYQPHIPDFFWAPNKNDQRPDSVFFRGSSFQWFSIISSVGEHQTIDSLAISLRIQSRGELVYSDTLFVENFMLEDSISLDLPTSSWSPGTYTLTAQINSDRQVLEKRLENNILSTNFELIEETASPILEVSFDDKVLAQGALVRRSPKLDMRIRKFDGVVPITEDQLSYELRQPDGSAYGLEEVVTFSKVDTGRVMGANWSAGLDLDQVGSYSLTVTYTPIGGGVLDEIQYRIEFRREDARQVHSAQLLPNPTAGDLFISYDISGASGPSAWSLQLINGKGQIVWEAEGLQPLPVGEHQIPLAVIPPRVSNGMYIYRFQFLDTGATLFDGSNGQIQGQLLLIRP